MQGKDDTQVRTMRIGKLSCCQDVIRPLSEEQYLYRYASGCPRCFWTLKEEGWSQQDIAAALGVSEGAVSQWIKRGREGGMEALKAHPPKGVSPRLTAEQKAQIPELIAKGAEAYGFRGDVWTASRVAEVIKRTFGVRYHRDHVGKLMREAGWSRQKPVERASQRNEEALKNWLEERWPDIKKKPSRTRRPSSG
jgi:transposase